MRERIKKPETRQPKPRKQAGEKAQAPQRPQQEIAQAGMSGSAGLLSYIDQLESSFNRPLGHIQAHTGKEANEASLSLGAKAYATQGHVVLGQGCNLKTVAEETAHVLQQEPTVSNWHQSSGLTDPGGALEMDAQLAASNVAMGRSASVSVGAGPGVISRSPLTDGIKDLFGGQTAGEKTQGKGDLQTSNTSEKNPPLTSNQPNVTGETEKPQEDADRIEKKLVTVRNELHKVSTKPNPNIEGEPKNPDPGSPMNGSPDKTTGKLPVTALTRPPTGVVERLFDQFKGESFVEKIIIDLEFQEFLKTGPKPNTKTELPKIPPQVQENKLPLTTKSPTDVHPGLKTVNPAFEPSKGSGLLKNRQTFDQGLIDSIVESTRVAKGKTTVGKSLLDKRVNAKVYQDIVSTQENAEQIIKDVLSNPKRTKPGDKFGQVDVIGESFGQEIGIRVNVEWRRFIGFRRPDF